MMLENDSALWKGIAHCPSDFCCYAVRKTPIGGRICKQPADFKFFARRAGLALVRAELPLYGNDFCAG
jgi:hypothetical protein